MLNKDTKVIVSGFGQMEAPNVPTFQEATTLENSLLVIKEHLENQNWCKPNLYEFIINEADNMNFIYRYYNENIRFAEKYENLRNCLKE